jgi:preprotein translocase subunit SecF
MLRILHDTHFDFISRTKVAAIGIAIFLLPALVMIALTGFRSGVEFTGGTLMQIEFKTAQPVSEVRDAIADAGIPNVEIQTFGAPNELVIRAQESEQVAQQHAGATVVASQIRKGLTDRFGAGSYTEIRAENIGPRVGSELRQQAVIAMLISFAITLIYLAWRFEWRFSLASVLATVHDIIATLALIKYLDLEISLFVVGGILTVIGYSLNDKVVVFDRVRENLRTKHARPLAEVLNRSINETLPRTVMTGSCTLATLLALLIFGGDVIRPFAWVLTFGILIGTFSSIYVAAPILLWIERKWPRTTDATSKTTARPGAADPRAASRAAARPARAQ